MMKKHFTSFFFCLLRRGTKRLGDLLVAGDAIDEARRAIKLEIGILAGRLNIAVRNQDLRADLPNSDAELVL